MNHQFRGSLFRILRVTLLVLALIGGALWLRRFITSLHSEQAVINAEIVQIRTPITGVLEIEDVRPGMLLKKGDPIFKVTNQRFGDREAVAQYNLLQAQVETLRSELASAKRDLEVDEAEQKKQREYFQRGIVSRIAKETAETSFTTVQKLVENKREQLEHVEKRAQEMEAQMNLEKKSEMTAPEDGLIWSIAGKSGEQVNSNTLIMEVINPSRIWVDAFFSESHAQDLRPGLMGTIRSLDDTVSWRGALQSIRGGVGRMAYDTTVAVPPPEMTKRQIAVRVDANWERPFTAAEFYGVGRSVEVTFTKGQGQRTVGDLLKEKWLHAFTATRTTGATQASR